MGLDYLIDKLGILISVFLGIDFMVKSNVFMIIHVKSTGFLRLMKLKIVNLVCLKRKGSNIYRTIMKWLFQTLFWGGVELLKDCQMCDVFMIISLSIFML